ncbi:hypothetical protein [Streptomyces sp. SD15]
MLGLYGVGALAGLTVGGRNADRAPFTVLLVGMGLFAVVAVVLAVTASSARAAIPLHSIDLPEHMMCGFWGAAGGGWGCMCVPPTRR